MKAWKIVFYIFNTLLTLMMLMSAYFSITQSPDAVKLMEGLGYPMYLNTILGVAKVLGVIGIWQRKFPNLREWAYAGFFFDFLGAALSYALNGNPVSEWFPIIIMLLLLVVLPYVAMRKAIKQA